MDVQGIGRSVTGLVRHHNEDVLAVDIDLGLYAVCDGMGGAKGGEVAAAMAIGSIERSVKEQREAIALARRDPSHRGDLEIVLVKAFELACQEIHAKASADPELFGMGTTATVLVTAGLKAAMAHVGDSRLYLIRGGQTHQLSSDQTLAAELVRQGVIEPWQERGHPHAHVLTNVVGTQPSVQVETLTFDLLPGDRLMLCSDGLGDYIPSDAWLTERFTDATIEEVVDQLIDFALSSGGRDNITVVAIAVEGDIDGGKESRASAGRLLDVLGTSFLFAELSLAQLSRVLERAEIKTFAAGELIRGRGDILTELLVVVSGEVRVETSNGAVATVGAGQHLGEDFVMRPRPTRAEIAAAEETTVLALEGGHLVELLNTRPWLGVVLLSRLVERLSSELSRRADPGSALAQPVAGDLL